MNSIDKQFKIKPKKAVNRWPFLVFYIRLKHPFESLALNFISKIKKLAVH